MTAAGYRVACPGPLVPVLGPEGARVGNLPSQVMKHAGANADHILPGLITLTSSSTQ